MNFKIESKIINIMNYPSAERHFENMAAKGWLISKITLESICIYKKIKAEQLEFSISPYEVETMFTKKTKAEIEEFQSVCETVGWNYASKQGDLHVYFKEKGSDVVDIETDEEEEFKVLKQIGKKQLSGLYFQTVFFLFLSYSFLSNALSDIYIMKEDLILITAIMIPLYSITNIKKIIDIRRFIKKNDDNIELGRNIEYRKLNFYFENITNIITLILLVFFVVNIVFKGVLLKNKIILMTGLLAIISVLIGLLFRIFIKPSKKTLNYKKRLFAIVIVVSVVITTSIGIISMGILSTEQSNSNIIGYRVLSVNDFSEREIKAEEDLRRNTSILVPKSYEVTSHDNNEEYIRTEYLNALNESIAKNLIKRYKMEAEKHIERGYWDPLEDAFQYNEYNDYLLEGGFTEEDFDSLKSKGESYAINKSKEMVKARSITRYDKNLWNVDQVYFLNYKKTKIVLRKGKEVFYLEGKDFSDLEIINISKEKLKLL